MNHFYPMHVQQTKKLTHTQIPNIVHEMQQTSANIKTQNNAGRYHQ